MQQKLDTRPLAALGEAPARKILAKCGTDIQLKGKAPWGFGLQLARLMTMSFVQNMKPELLVNNHESGKDGLEGPIPLVHFRDCKKRTPALTANSESVFSWSDRPLSQGSISPGAQPLALLSCRLWGARGLERNSHPRQRVSLTPRNLAKVIPVGPAFRRGLQHGRTRKPIAVHR